MLTLTAQESNTLLAALTFYKDSGMGEPANRSGAIHTIATDDDRDISLDDKGIDDLNNKILSANIVLCDGPTSSPHFIQSLVYRVMNELLEEGQKSSDKRKDVRINLIASTRMEYSEEVLVPLEFDDDQLYRLTHRAYSEIDSGVFTEDPEYWEKGECSYETLNQQEVQG